MLEQIKLIISQTFGIRLLRQGSRDEHVTVDKPFSFLGRLCVSSLAVSPQQTACLLVPTVEGTLTGDVEFLLFKDGKVIGKVVLPVEEANDV